MWFSFKENHRRKCFFGSACSQLAYVSDVQPYSLRSNGSLRLPQLRSNIGQKSFLYRGTQLYNEMVQNNVATDVLLKDFKVILSKYVAEKF